MKIIEPSHEIQMITGYTETDKGYGVLRCIEEAARTCYKSEDKMTDDSAFRMVKSLIERGHEAMLEFAVVRVKFITSRGISHEIVRHRLFSYAQESSRYCDYGKAGEIQVILPPELDDSEGEGTKYHQWWHAIAAAETSYNFLRDNGVAPQIARDVLPTCLKTEIVCQANMREWRHLFKQRTAKPAHPHMRSLMIPVLQELRSKVPIVFDDIEEYDAN